MMNLGALRAQATERLFELTNRIAVKDLTTLEVFAIVAVLEPADQRVNAPQARLLQLAPGARRRGSRRTGTAARQSASK
jgi:hypothetical protein